MMRYLFAFLFFVQNGASAQDLHSLLQACAPLVHPETMASIIATESGGNPLAILDNGQKDLPREKRVMRSYRPQTKDEAVNIARGLIAAGHIVDLGLNQINHRNLGKLGMTVEDAFDPCKSAAGGQTVLRNFYVAAAAKQGYGRDAMLSALSAYNTGSFTAGFKNGYVDKVIAASKRPAPSIKIAPATGGGVIRVVYGSPVGHGVILGKITKQEAKLASAEVVGW